MIIKPFRLLLTIAIIVVVLEFMHTFIGVWNMIPVYVAVLCVVVYRDELFMGRK